MLVYQRVSHNIPLPSEIPGWFPCSAQLRGFHRLAVAQSWFLSSNTAGKSPKKWRISWENPQEKGVVTGNSTIFFLKNVGVHGKHIHKWKIFHGHI